MVTTTVKAKQDGVRDNGKTYRKGDEFGMEISVAKAHEAAGQVGFNTEPNVKKAIGTPANKQIGSSRNK